MTPEERAMARGTHVRPAADGHYYDPVHAAIAHREELDFAMREVRWALAREMRTARHLLHFLTAKASAAEEADDYTLARAFEHEARARREVLFALRAVARTAQRVRP